MLLLYFYYALSLTNFLFCLASQFSSESKASVTYQGENC
uniref:Uncharacterized protein n=1 Tax=Anguilla anguilla TaxID=7936 RepID=A0A0E9PIK4_ANGAN